MQLILKEHEQFLLGLTYKENDTGYTKDAMLHYVPRHVFDKFNTFEELIQDEKAFQEIGCKTIQGNTSVELKQRMKKAENELLTIHEAIKHVKQKK